MGQNTIHEHPPSLPFYREKSSTQHLFPPQGVEVSPSPLYPDARSRWCKRRDSPTCCTTPSLSPLLLQVSGSLEARLASLFRGAHTKGRRKVGIQCPEKQTRR